MSKRVYIVDLIGSQSGMHYYHHSLVSVFKENPEIDFRILSNYREKGLARRFFPNIYSGNFAWKFWKYLFSFKRFLLFFLFHPKAHFLYLSYGRNQDVPFLWLARLKPEGFMVDIHDFYDINDDTIKNKLKIDKVFGKIQKTIVHSDSSAALLNGSPFKGSVLHVPHFHYNVDVEKETKDIGDDVENAIQRDKINLLYFGHIRMSKGIIELFELINALHKQEFASVFHIIIAGKDTNDLIKNNHLFFDQHISHSMIIRHITDGELEFLFSNCTYVILPYRDISQSGVLEMAIKHKKPVLLSSIPEFRNYLEYYPSFGHLFPLRDTPAFVDVMDVIRTKDHRYFLEKDVRKYYSSEKYDAFRKEFLSKFLI